MKPGTFELGSNYDLKVYVSESVKKILSWELGTLKMPLSIDYKLADIEDHFYKMPEIYTPEEDIIEGKKNALYPIAGLVFVVILPWLYFIKLVSFGNFDLIVKLSFFSGKNLEPISRFPFSYLTIPNQKLFLSSPHRSCPCWL